MRGGIRDARRSAFASAMNGASTQTLKSRISAPDRWRAPARSISAIEPTAPAISARRAARRDPGPSGKLHARDRRVSSHRFLSRAGDVGLPAEHAAVLDDQPRGHDVAEQHAGRLNLDTLRGRDVAHDRAADEDRAGVQVGFHLGTLAQYHFVLPDFDRALDMPVDPDVLLAGDPAVDGDALSDPGDLTAFVRDVSGQRELLPTPRRVVATLADMAPGSPDCGGALRRAVRSPSGHSSSSDGWTASSAAPRRS